MSILLYRVDERLLHGQVIIGWGNQLRPRRYLVVDDHLAGSDWEQELYRLSLPDETVAEFVDVETGRRRLDSWRGDDVRSVLLTRDVETMARLAEGGTLEGEKINLGGIHAAEGRQQVRSYLYLGDSEREQIRRLEAEGVEVTGKDLPDSTRVSLETLLGEE